MRCVERFEEIYGKSPDGISFCPYRVCPIGAHSDYNLGKVTGLALNHGIYMAYRPKTTGIVEIRSLNFPTRAQWHISAVPDQCQHDWADYLRGATWALAKRYTLHTGVCGIIEGSLPIGGLSSSASVIITFLSALCKVNNIRPTQAELINIALDAEKNYVGISVGTLDQSCEVYSKKDHLLYLDTQDNSFELIPTSPAMKPYKIAVFFSGLERSLVGSALNMRVDESRAAAYALKAFAGMEYGKFLETNLREIPYETYLEHRNKLPENWRRRAEHWYTEFQRVEKGAEAWRRGDIETYGKLSFESGYSSIHNWQTGSPELNTLYEIMTQTDGIYGGRFSGAGFKGCAIALIDPAYEEAVVEQVAKKYLAAFPHLDGKFSANLCQSADGVCL